MAAKKKTTSSKKRWSAKVPKTSDAMYLQQDVFKQKDPEKIARSVKNSAEKSARRKSGPYQSAMSMLYFYTNRAGKNLTATEKKRLEKAKEKLRELFHRAGV